MNTHPTNRTELLRQLEELKAKEAELKAALELERDEELKKLIEIFKAQLTNNGFLLEEALELLTTKKPRIKRDAGLPKTNKDFEVGVSYKNPSGDEVWVGGSRGKRPAWLTAILNAGSTFDSIKMK